MSAARLEAFSDGVLAIVITIMVLELHPPHGAEWGALVPLLPKLLSYVLSFIYLGIYWNNHHHLIKLAGRVNGAVLWANMHLLFWLSLIPFTTAWVGEEHFARLPVALYGVSQLMPAFAWKVLQTTIVRHQGPDSPIAQALGSDAKGLASLGLYALGVGVAFVLPWLAMVLYGTVSAMWLIPDRRFEARLAADGSAARAEL